MTTLKDDIRNWPTSPGVYLMKDGSGNVLYVGKARNLRERIASYFHGRDERYQVAFLMRRVVSLDHIVAATEKEALLLEYTLIQKYKPKYNIFWKDDKSYVRIRLTTQHAFPGIYTTRNVTKDGAQYFGPYVSATACRETVETIVRHCRLRTCTDREFANRARPCIQYQIGRCTAPCVGKVSEAAYALQVRQAELLLEGRTNEVRDSLHDEMQRASDEMRFEEAAQLRDRLKLIDETLESQRMVRGDDVDEDWIGWAQHKDRSVVSLLMVRGGCVQDKVVSIETKDPDDASEVVQRFLLQYYQPPITPPPVIYWPFEVAPSKDLEQLLTERRAGRVSIRHPKRGQKRELLQLAQANADAVLASRGSDEDRLNQSLRSIERALHLPQYPFQMECIDISNWDGEQAVGAVVVFQDGKPAKSDYRHYNIRGPHEPNDYAMMYETLARRYAKQPAPQLLLVDGGRGQLQIALRVIEDLRLSPFPVAAIAKGRGKGSDRIFLPNRKNPLPLKSGNPALLLLQRIRDAAHHFGNSFVRHKMRKKRVKKS
ncbi:MAG: excinuclease ABC subunit C [Deltaproteobacteria bacterium CG11_big_fil_rev_8_21_14_0_20_47_16]|nr:MAG: excinuclease ABC subunit C [Deltaproteobacteria bacterium CG11_big_fil_rev_8_21_14_0_20_47_16]